jgi:hypothetical protein
MDENKQQELIQIGYTIRHCCGTCRHGMFSNTDWGTCQVRTYEHLKHSEATRQLSINRYGFCDEDTYDVGPYSAASLGAFRQFLEER